MVANACCHRAAAHFGVNVSSAKRWSKRLRHENQLASKPMSEDHTSKHSLANFGPAYNL